MDFMQHFITHSLKEWMDNPFFLLQKQEKYDIFIKDKACKILKGGCFRCMSK